MENIRLEIPSIKYEKSFLEYINDYKVSGDKEYMYVYRDAYKDFKQYVSKLNNNSKGIDLPEGYVPCSSFWLVNDKEEVLGSIRIRHGNIPFDGNIGYDIAPKYRGNGYGNKILELALPYAKEIGLDKVVLNCAKANIRSEKVILNNNGIFFKSHEKDGNLYNQFEIKL